VPQAFDDVRLSTVVSLSLVQVWNQLFTFHNVTSRSELHVEVSGRWWLRLCWGWQRASCRYQARHQATTLADAEVPML
jgi:hypothetical protein